MNPNFVTEFARKPFLQPDPGNSQPFIPSYTYGDSTKSILCDDLPLDQKFKNLEKNTPEMIRLQDQNLDPGPQAYIHKGSVPLWVNFLSQTKIHLYSLCPIPKIELEDMKYVLDNIFDQSVAPSRAAWALHMIIRKLNKPVDLTAMLLDRLSPANPNERPDEKYFAQVCFNCYKEENILNPLEFLTGAISKMQPESLKIFKNEIIRTHVLTVAALGSSINYLSEIDEKLLLQKSHLIQLSLFYHLSQNPTITILSQNFTSKKYAFGPNIDELMMRSDLLKKRARSVYQIVTPTLLSLSTQLTNIIVAAYPCFDEAKTSVAIERAALYASSEACQKVVIDLFKILFLFEGENAELSSIIVWTLTKINVTSVDIGQLVDFFYSNVEAISKLRHLFAELQAFGLVDYNNVIDYILSRGFIITQPDSSRIILSSLPFYTAPQSTLKRFKSCMLKLNVKGYDQILQEISVRPLELSILANIDKFRTLPYPIIYRVAVVAIKETTHVCEMIDVIFQLNLDTLFPLLVDRIISSKDLKITINTHIMPSVLHALPFLVSHKQFSQFIDLIIQNSSDPVILDMAKYILEMYKDLPRRNEFNEIQKNTKGISIDSVKIRELFRRFSYLCSLHIFDAFHNIETTHDFEVIFRTFLSQLLHFHSLKSSTMIKFFLEFAQSGCVSLPPNFFIKNLLAVLLTFPEEDFDDRLNSLLQDFFTFIFEKGLFQPSNFLADSKKRRGGNTPSSPSSKIANIFLTICKARPDLFTPLNCFSSNSIKGFANEPKQLAELVNVLKERPLPQLTDEVLKSFDDLTLSGTYFALLPEEARDPNFDKAFDFFRENATESNCRLLAYWLKYHLYFSSTPQPGMPPSDFPVTLISPDKQAIAKFPTVVAVAFYNLFTSLSPYNEADEKRRDVFLNAWTLICQTDTSRYKTALIATAALSHTTNAIKTTNVTYTTYLVDYLHPALLLGAPIQIDSLLDTLLSVQVPPDQQGAFFYTAASVFVSYVPRQQYPITARIENTACRLMEWIDQVQRTRNVKGLDFLMDALNFMTCCTSNLSSMDQQRYHDKLKEVYTKLPDDVKDAIILNIPPQSFEPEKDPLHMNVTIPNETPQPVQQQQMMPPPPPPPPTQGFNMDFDYGHQQTSTTNQQQGHDSSNLFQSNYAYFSGDLDEFSFDM